MKTKNLMTLLLLNMLALTTPVVVQASSANDGGCNPLAANACSEGKVCWTDISLQTIMTQAQSYKCSTPDDCGEGSECTIVSAPASYTGAGGAPLSAQVCIPKGECVDASIHAKFEAYLPTEFKYELNTKECIALLKGEKVDIGGNQQMSAEELDQLVQRYTGDVMKFTTELESADAVMDDYFNINIKGKDFAIAFNKSREISQNAYIDSRAAIDAKYKQMISEVEGKQRDMASSVEYYDFMASIFELEASSSAAFLKQFTDIYGGLEGWGNQIATPISDYYTVGKAKDRGLGLFLGTEEVVVTKNVPIPQNDNGNNVDGNNNNNDDNNGQTQTVKVTYQIPKYELRVNICNQMGKRNGDCVKMCEHKGKPVVDPIIEVEKKKKSGGFLGLGKLFCNIGKIFGSKKDCNYKYTEQLADHFIEYGSSPQCSYIAKDSSKSAAMNKLATIQTIREKVSTLANFYENTYKMNTELAQCMKKFSGDISGLYDGQSGGYVENGNTTDKSAVESGAKGNVKVDGKGAINVAGNVSSQGFALAAYRKKLRESFASSREGEMLSGTVDPLASESGQKALRDSIAKYRSSREEVSKKSKRFVENAKKEGQNSPAYGAIEKFRSTANKLNVFVDNSKGSDPYSLGTTSKSPFSNEDLIASINSGATLQGNQGNSSPNGSLSGGAGGNARMGVAGSTSSAAMAAKAKAEAEKNKSRSLKVGADGSAKSAGHNAAGLINGEDQAGDDEGGKKKLAEGEAKTEEELLAEKKTEVPLPPNFDEYDMASMLNDVQSEQYKYSRRPSDSLWDIITKTYMRSAIKTFYGDHKATISDQ